MSVVCNGIQKKVLFILLLMDFSVVSNLGLLQMISDLYVFELTCTFVFVGYKLDLKVVILSALVYTVNFLK